MACLGSEAVLPPGESAIDYSMASNLPLPGGLARLYPDLSVVIGPRATSTMKPDKSDAPDLTLGEDVVVRRLEPSAPPANIVSGASIPCHTLAKKNRDKTDLHKWSQWRCRMNQELADFMKGARQDVAIAESFNAAFSGCRVQAIYHHAVTRDSPSTCLDSVPYLLYGIPRVKSSSVANRS